MITDYSEEEVKKLVKDGLCDVQALRDYQVVKQVARGDKVTHVALDHNISRKSVYNILNKYNPKV